MSKPQSDFPIRQYSTSPSTGFPVEIPFNPARHPKRSTDSLQALSRLNATPIPRNPYPDRHTQYRIPFFHSSEGPGAPSHGVNSLQIGPVLEWPAPIVVSWSVPWSTASLVEISYQVLVERSIPFFNYSPPPAYPRPYGS
jgi:hypothetical protein